MIGQENSAGFVQNEVAGSAVEMTGIPQKSRKVLDEKAELYRHYDVHGRLLYVGVSLSCVARLAQHREHGRWFKLISNITVAHFSTRAAALEAEVKAIKDEKPFFNKKHNGMAKYREWVAPKSSIRAGEQLAYVLKATSARHLRTGH
jgi:excinuclease UvrABC nuclease subunit